jgi:nitroreductase
MKLIENLNWRYATKKFNPERKVSAEDIEKLKEAVRLSVSSYGLQLYRILIISNEEVRQQLRKESWDQSQITDASHLFVFCNCTNNYGNHVDDYIKRIEKATGENTEGLSNYASFIKSNIDNMSILERQSWTEKQTYLALNNLLIACAELKIDACPMEGFDNQRYNQILGLDEMGLNAAVIAPVGYRHFDDAAIKKPKVRKPSDLLFINV